MGNAVEQHNATKVYRQDLCSALVDNAIVTTCKKSLPFTSIPLMLDHTARVVKTIAGPNLSTIDIANIRKVSPNTAEILLRLKALNAVERTSNGSRMACRRGVTHCIKRLATLADRSLALKVKFLRKCSYLCLTCDETDSYCVTAPYAVGIQGCSADFGWGNFFIGLTDVALDKTGKGCYDATAKILQSAEDVAGPLGDEEEALMDMIFSLTTDGASAMRSTAFYAGLDAKPDGNSLVAYFKRDKPLIGNLHGCCHNVNLALKDALEKTTNNWADVWLLHIRALYNWFRKSPSRKAKFKHLHEQFELLGRAVTCLAHGLSSVLLPN